MQSQSDRLMDTLDSYVGAALLGDAERMEVLRGEVRETLSAFVIEAVREDLRANGPLRQALLEDCSARAAGANNV